MKNNKYILAFIFSLFLTINLRAQVSSSDTVSNIQHALILYKIQAAYDKLEHTSFNVKYQFKKSDNLNMVLDSSAAEYHMHSGMMKGTLSNNELLLNSEYYLTMSPEESIISISRAGGRGRMFQLNFFDSLFQRANIKGFERTIQNDSTLILKILFKPNSYYKDYQITYTNRFLIKKITLKYPDSDYDGNINGNKMNVLELTYNNYRTETFDIGVFSEGRYVSKNQNGKFVGVGTYNNFQIITNEPDL